MPQLDFSTWIGQIFWLIFTFSVMYILMTTLVLPRMKNIYDRREQKISGDIKRAEELHSEIQNVTNDCEYALSKAYENADEIISKANEDATAVIDERMQKAMQTLDANVDLSLKRIEKQKSEAIASLDMVVTEIAVETLHCLAPAKNAEKMVKDALKA